MNGFPFAPHGYCLFWNLPLLASHILGDVLIALAYFMIPPVLFALRKLISWYVPRMALLLFGAFIVSCGMTHVMDIVVIWYPLYYTQAVIKLVTASISLLAGAYIFSVLLGDMHTADYVARIARLGRPEPPE